uniref:C-type lectin domain-containing protein n=1 Tax=Labrus bergylta TaxID=56723 RepID=A0A3Q3GA10_9LABR
YIVSLLFYTTMSGFISNINLLSQTRSHLSRHVGSLSCSDFVWLYIWFASLNLTQSHIFWGRAQLYCKAYHTVLASVRNDQENSEIQQLVGDERFVWIGLYRETWRSWSGGANSKFQNWVDGHPRNLTESCGASVFDANHTGEWVEKYCKDKLPFICHTKSRCVCSLLK